MPLERKAGLTGTAQHCLGLGVGAAWVFLLEIFICFPQWGLFLSNIFFLLTQVARNGPSPLNVTSWRRVVSLCFAMAVPNAESRNPQMCCLRPYFWCPWAVFRERLCEPPPGLAVLPTVLTKARHSKLNPSPLFLHRSFLTKRQVSRGKWPRTSTCVRSCLALLPSTLELTSL